MNTTISILTELPEDLHAALLGFLEGHPTWDQDRLLAAAVSLFLLQAGDDDRRPGQVYLETLFEQSIA